MDSIRKTFTSYPRPIWVILTAGLAFLAVGIVVFGSLSIMQKISQNNANDDTYTEEEKLVILANLRGSSTPSKKEQKAVLEDLQEEQEIELTDEQKLQVLNSLR